MFKVFSLSDVLPKPSKSSLLQHKQERPYHSIIFFRYFSISTGNSMGKHKYSKYCIYKNAINKQISKCNILWLISFSFPLKCLLRWDFNKCKCCLTHNFLWFTVIISGVGVTTKRKKNAKVKCFDWFHPLYDTFRLIKILPLFSRSKGKTFNSFLHLLKLQQLWYIKWLIHHTQICCFTLLSVMSQTKNVSRTTFALKYRVDPLLASIWFLVFCWKPFFMSGLTTVVSYTELSWHAAFFLFYFILLSYSRNNCTDKPRAHLTWVWTDLSITNISVKSYF